MILLLKMFDYLMCAIGCTFVLILTFGGIITLESGGTYREWFLKMLIEVFK